MNKGEKNIGISTMLVDTLGGTSLYPDLLVVGTQVGGRGWVGRLLLLAAAAAAEPWVEQCC
jgi:hypothetical protein